MTELQRISRSADVRGLIDQFFHLDEVIAIALGVDGRYLDLCRVSDTRPTTDAALDQLPHAGWAAVCDVAGLENNPSPVYVVLYVSLAPDVFKRQYAVPDFTTEARYAVRVEFREPYRAVHDRTTHRPNMPGGISVSGDAVSSSGTLGGFLKSPVDGSVYLMSCFHVLHDGPATAATQRARGDGGRTPSDDVGTLSYCIPLVAATGFTAASPYHRTDAALAEVGGAAAAGDPFIRIVRRRVASTRPLSSISLGDDVVFVGKESDRREAKVFRFIARSKWFWNGTAYHFGDLFELEPRVYQYWGALAAPGDSGSWVLYEDPDDPEELEAAGVVFGASGAFALCCFMEYVIADLEAKATTTLSYL